MRSCKQTFIINSYYTKLIQYNSNVHRLRSNYVIRYTLLNTKELKYDTYALRQYIMHFLCFVVVHFVCFVVVHQLLYILYTLYVLLLYTSVILIIIVNIIAQYTSSKSHHLKRVVNKMCSNKTITYIQQCIHLYRNYIEQSIIT